MLRTREKYELKKEISSIYFYVSCMNSFLQQTILFDLKINLNILQR